MSPRPPPADLLPWALSCLTWAESGSLYPVAGDASSRRYFRLQAAGRSAIVAESPPATEKNAEFIARQTLLARSGVRVPALLAVDLDRGFLLLEDLGDAQLLPQLREDTAEDGYTPAFAMLAQFARIELAGAGLPAYDEVLLREELSRFDEWFVGELLGYALAADESALLTRLYDVLVVSALSQPQVFVHRDFHSRNLMCVTDDDDAGTPLQAVDKSTATLAVIDFQDAVAGPLTYDLVSLLRDCYIRWPQERVTDWALAFRRQLLAQGQPGVMGEEAFLRAMDWMGLQRHIKVLGTFARLYLRDGKQAYLADLPRVLDYVLDRLARYSDEEPAFAEALAWYQDKLAPIVAGQNWKTPA